MDALDWKRFYAAEREDLGHAGLDALLDAAPDVPLGQALVFPHTRARHSGSLVAAVARAVVAARADRVLTLGVLHGARRQDAVRVERARAGDAEALAELRRVHGPGGHAAEEFSLDLFEVLLARAAVRAGVPAPAVVARYPFLVGTDPESLPGMDELIRLVEDGCALVATTDPIHHGVGYGTAEHRDATDPSTHKWATSAVRRQLDALQRRDWDEFARTAAALRSDFRDTGPVLAWSRPGATFRILELTLVDYADVLGAPPPTWVAAALVATQPQLPAGGTP